MEEKGNINYTLNFQVTQGVVFKEIGSLEKLVDQIKQNPFISKKCGFLFGLCLFEFRNNRKCSQLLSVA